MRLSLAVTVGMLLGLASIFTSCGGERTATADRPASAATISSVDATVGKARRTVNRCRAQLGDFLTVMDALREELASGLTYDGYLDEVRGVRSTYDDIRAERLAIGCLLASGGPAERAFNLYIDAANIWGDCLAKVSCDTASIEPQLRRKWALASNRLSTARRGMRDAARG